MKIHGFTFPQRVLALGHARFCTTPGRSSSDRYTVSGHCQKAMALAVLASRGRPITIEALSDMASCCHDTGKRALNVLFERQIVTYRGPAPAARRAGAYRINWARVIAAVPPSALDAISEAHLARSSA